MSLTAAAASLSSCDDESVESPAPARDFLKEMQTVNLFKGKPLAAAKPKKRKSAPEATEDNPPPLELGSNYTDANENEENEDAATNKKKPAGMITAPPVRKYAPAPESSDDSSDDEIPEELKIPFINGVVA